MKTIRYVHMRTLLCSSSHTLFVKVGNVKSSINIPSIEFDDQLDDLIEQCIIDELDTIVFHCHFSQMRGPSAALKFQEAFSKKHPDKDHLQVQVLTGGWKYWYARYRNHENRDQLIELH